MHLSDDEDDQNHGGIPDISGRKWRHPSEVAAGLAATSTEVDAPAEEPPPVARRPYLVGAVLAAAFCTIGLVLGGILQPGAMLDTTSQPSAIGAELDFPSERTLVASLQPGPAEGNETQLQVGVFTAPGEGAEFVARFVKIDDYILTSAAALDGQTTTTIRLQESPGSPIVQVPAVVDRVITRHDIAVLTPTTELPDLTESESKTPTDQNSAQRTPEDNNGAVTVEGCDPATTVVKGQIRILDVSTTATNGAPLEGLSQTSIPSQSCGAGSPVLGSQGELVGMVAATNSPQVLFVPVEALTAEIERG